jgi:hypothetical protein
MRYSNTLLYTIATVVAFVWLNSCNFTSTYMPELNGKQAAIIDSIDTKYRFEDISLKGKKITGSSGAHTSLTIEFINGKNLPTDDDKITALAKQLASQIRQTLKNPNEFETYEVMFDVRVVDGATTTNRYVSHEFKASEL